MQNVRRVSWMTAVAVLAVGSAAAWAALPTMIKIQTDQGVCDATLQVTNCSLSGTPAPGSTPTPTPTNGNPVPTQTPGGSGGACPEGALDLNHPFERQATLLGYDRLRVSGSTKMMFCGRTTQSTSTGGNLGAAWQDGGGACTQIRLSLVSHNGNPVTYTSGWSNNPQLPYKFAFPRFRAPVGDYVFELEANASNCANGNGVFQVIWTPY